MINYEIKSIGTNVKIIDNEYIFVPFSNRTVITINIKIKKTISFVIDNENINYVSVLVNNGYKQRMTDKSNNIILCCEKDDKIKIVPHYKNASNAKIVIKNIDFVKQKQQSFIIVTTKWGIKIAESLNNMLEELNYKTNIIYDNISDELLENNKKNPDEYFIILFSHLIKKMPEPKKYILYQLEQKRQSKLITEKVLNNIKNSLITWDYSNENILQFGDDYKNKIVFQPISIINKFRELNLPIKYDLLFFGSDCMRRAKIIRFLRLKKKYNIYLSNNIFGEELYELIAQSRIILNLHVYEDAILEIARLNEVLAFNKLIISELPCNGDNINKEFYQDKVIFCDVIKYRLGNIESLTNLIDYYLDVHNYDNFIKQNKKNIDLIYSNSLNYLKKNLEILNENQTQVNTNSEYKIYVSKSEVNEYAKSTDTIWGDKIPHIVNYVLKNNNHFNVDCNFYNKINRLVHINNEETYRHIKEYGIENGLIYHSKQLKNIFHDIEIYEDSDNKIYIKKDNDFIEGYKYINDELYNKDLEWYMNQITIKEQTITNNELVLLVFIGDLEIGKILIQKIITYKDIETFGLGICFRNFDLYDNLKEMVIGNFDNYNIYITREYGNDILPTLLMYNKINQKIKFNKIIKLHTKSSDLKWFDEITNYLLETKIDKLSHDDNIKCNCIGSKKYYHKDENSMANIKILDKYRDYIDKEYFVRGSMFYCDKRVFDKMIEIIKLDYKMFMNNNMYDTNNINYINSPSHTLERLFGIIKI